jgi:lysine-N-methylase
MSDARGVRQPQYFGRFRCIGAECEDTCCSGWGIVVDSATYERYQRGPDLKIAGRSLSSLVEINPAGSSSVDYAKMRLDGTACPALENGLCSIQQAFGESYIPDLCSMYPRVQNVIGGTIERSLHLSCPEAARLVLSDPEAMRFLGDMEGSPPGRATALSFVAGADQEKLIQVRELIIGVIQERSLPLGQRIVSLGLVIDQIAGVDATRAVRTLENHLRGLRQGLFAGIFTVQKSAPEFQLETVLEMIVARLGADYNSPRFLDCYDEFMRGLAWTNQSTMEEIAARYQQASRDSYRPFMRCHEHLLENYLVNYIVRTIFPYRSKPANQTSTIDSGKESMKSAFLLLVTHYAIVRTVMIGMAALHQAEFSVDHAVKLVQSYAKAFMHSGRFETTVLDVLRKNGEFPIDKVAALVMD